MKTPEEIKCGMECIRTNAERICVKPEKGQCPRCEQLVGEALVRIRQLEQRLAQVERERDAAVFDLHGHCDYCKTGKNDCAKCVYYHYFHIEEPVEDLWQWRGVCEENSP